MKVKLLTVAVAAALSVPFAALAQGSGGTTTAPSVNQPQGRDAPATQPAGSQADPSAQPGSLGGRSSAGASGTTYHSLDKNRDGYVSRDEARGAEWNSRFSSLDTDRDGKISDAEWRASGMTDSPAGAAARGGSGAVTGGAATGGASAPASTPSSGGPATNQGVPGGTATQPSKQPSGQ